MQADLSIAYSLFFIIPAGNGIGYKKIPSSRKGTRDQPVVPPLLEMPAHASPTSWKITLSCESA
jgi:hypothetical protein